MISRDSSILYKKFFNFEKNVKFYGVYILLKAETPHYSEPTALSVSRQGRQDVLGNSRPAAPLCCCAATEERESHPARFRGRAKPARLGQVRRRPATNIPINYVFERTIRFPYYCNNNKCYKVVRRSSH